MICAAHDAISHEFIDAYWAESKEDAALPFAIDQGYETVEEYEESGDGAVIIPVFLQFSVESLYTSVDGDNTLQIAARNENEFVGSAWVRAKEDCPSLLYDVYVTPEERGQKLGTAMILEAMYWAKAQNRSLQLHVAKENRAAQRLYERLGWLKAREDEDNIWYGCPKNLPLPQDVAGDVVHQLLQSE